MPALGRVERSLRGEHAGPRLCNHRQNGAIVLPVLGQMLRHQMGERVEGHPFGLQLVEQRRQFVGEA